MLQYKISYQKTHNRFIAIECVFDTNNAQQILIQLPVWRPGRYELGYFAKNIQNWKAFNENGKELIFQKTTHSSWLVESDKAKQIHVYYNYYAADLNAGSTFIDEKQLYVNPVNCLMYVKEKMQEECFLKLNIPDNFQVATGLTELSKFHFRADSYDQLVDCPFIASASLKHDQYTIDDVDFHLWFQGECKPDWNKIKADFQKFSQEQINTMQAFPAKEYHFLFQILPYKYYHGVEHTNSTVIALGPSYEIMKKEKLYDELLGVSSHELFHAWNIKTIRPKEMYPYDFSKENYSRLGYVAEGVTTYYGDLFLLRSGVFSEQDYFDNFNIALQKHFDNYGRYTYSVAESSFDTWLDGYLPGIPDRKVSIYTEGCLCAFMTDVLIRQATNNQKSLDDVMRILYHQFALKKNGYTEDDYTSIVEQVAQQSFTNFFEKYVYGKEDYEPLLKICFDYLGLELQKSPSKNYTEQFLGFKTAMADGRLKVTAIAPHSPAYKAGMLKEDEIIAINQLKISNNLNEWAAYFEDVIEITLSRADEIKKLALNKNEVTFYPVLKIAKLSSLSKEQENAYRKWRISANN